MTLIAFLLQILSLVLGLGSIIVLLAYYVHFRNKRAIRLINLLIAYLSVVTVINIPYIARHTSSYYTSFLHYLYYYLFLTYSLGLLFYAYPSFVLELAGIRISKTWRILLFILSFFPLYLYIPLMVIGRGVDQLGSVLYILGFFLLAMVLSVGLILLRFYKKLIGLWRKITTFLIVFSFAYIPFVIIDLFFPGIHLFRNRQHPVEIFPFATVFFLAFNFIIIYKVLTVTLQRTHREPSTSPHIDTEISREALDLYNITERESEIALAILKGKTNNEIAQEKSISLTTVKKHVYNIFQKTNARNRMELSNILRNGK